MVAVAGVGDVPLVVGEQGRDGLKDSVQDGLDQRHGNLRRRMRAQLPTGCVMFGNGGRREGETNEETGQCRKETVRMKVGRDSRRQTDGGGHRDACGGRAAVAVRRPGDVRGIDPRVHLVQGLEPAHGEC